MRVVYYWVWHSLFSKHIYANAVLPNERTHTLTHHWHDYHTSLPTHTHAHTRCTLFLNKTKKKECKQLQKRNTIVGGGRVYDQQFNWLDRFTENFGGRLLNSHSLSFSLNWYSDQAVALIPRMPFQLDRRIRCVSVFCTTDIELARTDDKRTHETVLWCSICNETSSPSAILIHKITTP